MSLAANLVSPKVPARGMAARAGTRVLLVRIANEVKFAELDRRPTISFAS